MNLNDFLWKVYPFREQFIVTSKREVVAVGTEAEMKIITDNHELDVRAALDAQRQDGSPG